MFMFWNIVVIVEKFGIFVIDFGIEIIVYSVDGIDYESVLFYNKVQLLVLGVLIVFNYFGLCQQVLEIVVMIIGVGYVILVVDVFGKSLCLINLDEVLVVIILLKKDCVELCKCMCGVLKVLCEQIFVKFDVGKLGVSGFCFGGIVVLELVCDGVDVCGMVLLYGVFDILVLGESKVKGVVLVLYGVQDFLVLCDQVNGFIDEMSVFKVDW